MPQAQGVLEKYLWLNNKFFEDALKTHLNDDSMFVKTFEIRQAVTNRNQNYWCDIIKVKINHTNSLNEAKASNVALKIATNNPWMEESIQKYDPFKRELLFYQNLLPKIEESLLSIEDKEVKLTEKPIVIVNERPQPKYLMIEELSADKFLKANRRLGLDVSHLKVALKNLAKLHAASAVLPLDMLTNHQQPNISEYFKVFHLLFINCVRSLVNGISSENDGETERLAKKINSFERNMIDKSSEAFMLHTDDFGVLCHGDLWLNNLLFEYDDEAEPVNVRLVDFGLSYFGSPGIDLSYLIFSSSSDDVKDFEIDILLQFYHQELHKNLIKLGYELKIPSLIQIHNYFLKCGVIGFMYSSLLLPMRFAGDSVKDLSFLVQQTEDALKARQELFNDASVKKRFQFLLNYFDRKGFLD